jgi:thioesterase domain-containing protein
MFAVPGGGGNVLSLRSLALTLGDEQPVYGFQGVGLDGKAEPPKSVEATARAYVQAMKTQQPTGPYHLLGHSYGGAIAFEMAGILLEQGEEVASLVLLDSVAPSVFRPDDEITEIVKAFRELANDAELELDVERLRRSSDRENAEFFVALLKERGLLDVNVEQFAALMNVCRVNLTCYTTYQPSRLPRPIDVSLYRATEGRTDEPEDYGWGPLLSQPLRAYDVAEANHYSVIEKVRLREPERELALV